MGDPPVNLSPVACVQSQPADKGEPLDENYGMYGLGHILREINPLKGLPESIVKSLDIENVTQSMSMRDVKIKKVCTTNRTIREPPDNPQHQHFRGRRHRATKHGVCRRVCSLGASDPESADVVGSPSAP